MWEEIDFLINRCYWHSNNDKKKLYLIRKQNLLDVIEVSSKMNVKLFLEGKTLASIYLINNFWPNDHDDDLGLFSKDFNFFLTEILPVLINKFNFKLIRKNENMISLERNRRYLDICNFKHNINGIGYGSKIFKSNYYDKLRSINRLGFKIFVPRNTLFLVLDRYSFKFFYEILRSVYIRLRKIIKFILNFKKSKKILEEQEFLELIVESKHSLNWIMRKPHLDIVTKNGKYVKVKDIIVYLRENLEKIESRDLKVSQISKISDYPLNLNKDFWYNGNDFFFNCVKYGFRHGVIPYTNVREYIENHSVPLIFSDAYYSSLIPMNTKQIEQLLTQNPIEIKDGCVVGGRHRVYAMIGQLLRNKTYVQFYYYKMY